MDPLTAISIGSSLLGGLGGSRGGGGQRISQEAVDRARQLGPLATFRPVTVTSSLGGMYGYGQTGLSPALVPGQPAMPIVQAPAYTAPRDLTQILRTTFTGPSGQTIRGQDALRDLGINLDAVSNTQAANMIDRAIASGVLTAPAGSAQTVPQPTMMQPSTTDLGFQLGGQYADITNRALAGASGLFQQLANYSPEARAAQIYREQEALLQPSFQQQATDLQSRLFGSGRLGLRLAGESQGLGTGAGMVQPDALGLGRAQQQTLAQLAAGARQQAFTEGEQMANLAGKLLTSGLGINEAERQMMALGIDAETARAAAQYAAGNLELQPYGAAATAANQAQANRMGLFGGISSGLLSNPGLFSSTTTNTSGFLNPMAQMSGNSVFMNDPRFGRVYFD